jgi:hypothetical protein
MLDEPALCSSECINMVSMVSICRCVGICAVGAVCIAYLPLLFAHCNLAKFHCQTVIQQLCRKQEHNGKHKLMLGKLLDDIFLKSHTNVFCVTKTEQQQTASADTCYLKIKLARTIEEHWVKKVVDCRQNSAKYFQTCISSSYMKKLKAGH